MVPDPSDEDRKDPPRERRTNMITKKDARRELLTLFELYVEEAEQETDYWQQFKSMNEFIQDFAEYLKVMSD